MHKPTRLPPLDALATFEAAARHLSFTLAGEERFVTQSAVSRQIRQLEDELGVPLFVRGHRSLSLTEDGRRLHEACASALEQLRGSIVQIRSRTRREVLALTTTPGFASLWLIPRLPLFTRAHPGVDVRIDADMAVRDLVRDGIDLAIRYEPLGRDTDEPLFGESMQPVCSPSLLRDGPALATPQDLRHHTLIQMNTLDDSGPPMDWAQWLQSVGLPELEPASVLSFNSYGETIGAAVAGHGVALGRRPLVDGLLRNGQLVAPLPAALASPRVYAVVLSPATGARPAVQALAHWLRQQAAHSASAAGDDAALVGRRARRTTRR